MSTAGRINKSGPRFVPKRKNPPATSSRPSREGSVASSTAGPTPKPPPVGLPPLGEDPIEEEREPTQTQTGTTTATPGSTALATATVGTSFRPGASFFAPSDPTAASSSQASTSNALGFHPSSSASFSTGNSGYTATQATSFGAPTQPPSGSKSPQRPGSLFLPDPETSPRPASAAAPSSSSPTRGTAFAVSNVPPTQLSPSRRAVELQPERPASPSPPPPVAASGGLPRKRKAQPANDAGEEEGSGAEAGSPRAKGKGKGKEKASGDEPPAKRAASTAGKKRHAPAAADDSDAETEDAVSDEGVTEPRATGATAKKATSKPRPKLRRPASRRRTLEAEEAEAVAAPAVVSTQAGDVAEETASDEDRAQPKKRARKRKPAKKGAVDRFLFGGSGDEADENAPEGDIAVGDAEGSADDGDEQPKKKKRSAPKKTVKKGKAAKKGKKAATGDAAEEGRDGVGEGNSDAEDGDGASPRAESPEPLPPVEPDETTMATLADPRPKVSIGRPSQRTIFFEEREQRVKAERKKLLKLKRERMKRIKKGLPVTDDENEGDQTPAAAANNRNGDGAAGSDAEGGGEDLPVNNADDEDAGSVDQRFRLPSLGADEDVDDAAAENGGPFSGLDAINAAMAARGENDGGSGDEDGGNGDEDEEDDAGFQETEWAPQMRIVDGQLVLDESSLQVERGGNTQQIINREVVEESAQDRFVNSSTYSKRKGGARWSKEETEMFYDAISQFYTNFEMIALLFPHRTRHEIRRKFNREDKLNPKLITAALARRKRVDIEAIAKITGADLSGPVPEDPMDEVNRRRAEIEANGGVDPDQQGGRKRKGKGKKEEGGEHDEDAAVLGAGRKRKGKKGAAGAAVGFMPGEEDEDAAEEEEDEELLQIQLEIAEEERQRRIDEMEAAGAGA
ncbi:hypothetical protein RHOSPDRAFT_30857 [Rhodotorula sp. JG-1b]|nr:hypothetical protein RHOSPDRAFT_30857 [Rhodotorula sp. JG-1b]